MIKKKKSKGIVKDCYVLKKKKCILAQIHFQTLKRTNITQARYNASKM